MTTVQREPYLGSQWSPRSTLPELLFAAHELEIFDARSCPHFTLSRRLTPATNEQQLGDHSHCVWAGRRSRPSKPFRLFSADDVPVLGCLSFATRQLFGTHGTAVQQAKERRDSAERMESRQGPKGRNLELDFDRPVTAQERLECGNPRISRGRLATPISPNEVHIANHFLLLSAPGWPVG